MTNTNRLIVAVLACVAIGFTSLAAADHPANADRPTREEWQTMSDADRQAARESRRAQRDARREKRGQMSPEERTAAREARANRGGRASQRPRHRQGRRSGS